MIHNPESHPFLLSALFCWMFLLVMCSTTVIDQIFDLNNANQALNTCSSNMPTEVQISSQCLQLCSEDETCVAYYTYPFSYRWRCFLFPYGKRHQYSNSTGQNGVSGVKIYPGSSLEADGLYYFIPAQRSLNFTYARKDCKVSLGYRLALLKTSLSFQVARTKYITNLPFTVVDLQQNIDDKNATFGDGTPFQGSQVAQSGEQLVYDILPPATRAVFVLYGNNFNDELANKPRNALCQGDPLGITL